MHSKSDGWLSFKKPTHEVQFDFEDPCRPLCMHHHYYHPWHEDAWRLEGPVMRDPRFRWLTCYFCIIPVTTPAMRLFRSFREFWKLNLFVKMCVELKVCCKEHVSLFSCLLTCGWVRKQDIWCILGSHWCFTTWCPVCRVFCNRITQLTWCMQLVTLD